MKRNPGALAKALYNNTPEAPNELFFRKGDVLTVIEYDYEGHVGWWLCAHRGQRRRALSHSGGTTHDSASAASEGNKEDKDFDPLETYDVPRSYIEQLQKRKQILRQQSESECASRNSNLDSDSDNFYVNQPLYQNEDAFPSPQITKTSPLDLYDVPRCQLPVYGQSITRARRYAQSELSLVGASASIAGESESERRNLNHLSLDRRGRNRLPGLNLATLAAASTSTADKKKFPLSSSTDIVQPQEEEKAGNPLSPKPPAQPQTNYPINHSNRSSVLSESAESGIVMVSLPQSSCQDLYDVPRSSLPMVSLRSGSGGSADNGNGKVSPNHTRQESSISMSSSGMGLSIANSDSKDSLDFYDVPRSVKSYVNHMETKYDQVHANTNGSSIKKGMDQQSQSSRHTRHNSTSSIFSAYGYSRQDPNKKPGLFSNGSRTNSIDSNCGSLSWQQVQGSELYDVPRNVPPPNPRTSRPSSASARPQLNGASSSSIASSVSQASLTSDGTTETDSGSLYDVPPSSSFPRKVSLCDSTETLNCQESIKSDDCESVRLGTSPTSLSRSHPHLIMKRGSGSSTSTLGSESREDKVNSEIEIKTMPLSPKAAVSWCEKLRHEVVTSINAILDFVKPKWRSRENLAGIMSDLRFSCTRLSLAIKDVADFATRCLSNAKQSRDPSLVVKLHRLLTPLINGAQIVQKDVDELEAYFWSVERLSVAVSAGSNHEKNAVGGGDALDQLVLCARNLKHDVTEIANFLAFNSSALFQDQEIVKINTGSASLSVGAGVATAISKPGPPEDYDYVSLLPTSENNGECESGSSRESTSSSLCRLCRLCIFYTKAVLPSWWSSIKFKG